MANESELIKEEFPVTILHSSQQEDGENWITGDIIKRWTDNPQGVSPEYPYEFCCTRYYTYKDKNNAAIPNSEKKGWQPWDIKNISLWSHYGMNASPYQLLLGNPYESIYAIEASGNTREAYVILDGDGVSTGEITLQGGNENSKGTYDLKIDNLYIVDQNNIEHSFNNSDYLTIDLGDNWNCRFQLSDRNGNPIINMVGIGPNPTDKITGDALPDTIELNSSDSCFKCNLEGKYQKKIAIKAVNLEKNVSIVTSWTITAIRDKNGDGIWRYRIMPNIDRVVRTSYFKKISDSQSNLINTVYNIGDADSVKFDIEKDTYGKAWRDITNQACRVVIKHPVDDGEDIIVSADGGPITVPIVQLQAIVDRMANSNPTLTQLLQYTVELQVVDPDYEATSEGYSVVDKCNLLFEYIVCEAGKDGEDGADGADGKNGVSTMFNLSNDNGTFAYDYHTGNITVNDKDKSTEIQYSEDSNYVCCTSLTIGDKNYTGSTSEGVCDKVHFSLVKGEKFWTLTVDSIEGDGDGDSSTYTQLFSLPIKGFKEGKEVGSATFKMSGVKDLNEDGVYLYRLIPEHQHSSLNSASDDTLNVDVYRDELIAGGGYSKEIPILVEIISKNKKENSTLGVVGGEDTKVSCASPIINLDTLVSMETVQDNMGVILKVYAKDPDYVDRAEFVNTKYPAYSGQGYHYTGEYEEVSWTAPAGSSSEITQEQIAAAVKMIVCNNNNIIVAEGAEYNFTFKDVSGNSKNVNISGIPEGIFNPVENVNGINQLTLIASTNLPSDPTSGEITYKDPSNSDIYGTIRYNWIGDQSLDGVYYTYDMSTSARVLGYNDDGTFTPKQITVTCYCTEYGNGSKKITPGTGYIGINDEKDISKLKSLNSSGQADIEIGKDYTGTTAFTIRWYTIDADFAASGTAHAFEKDGNKYYMVDEQPIDIVPTKVIEGASVTKNYKMVGQASRMRNYESLGTGTNYFYPTGYEMSSNNGDNDNIYEGISDSGTTIFFPKYYDILSYYDDTTKTTTYYRCVKYQKVTDGKPTNEILKNTEFWTSAQMEDFMAIDQLIANQIAATTVEADKLLVRTRKGEGTFEAGMINGYDTIEEKSVGDIRIFAGYGGDTAPVTNAPFRVDKTGKMTATNAEITGKVAATNFQVNATNTLTGIDLDDPNGVMWITTWGKARVKGTSNSISLKTTGEDDDIPVIVVKGRDNSFFVLNPLQLGNGAELLIGYFCYIELNNVKYSPSKTDVEGNPYVKIDPDFSIIDNIKLGYIKYSSKDDSLSLFSEEGAELDTDSNISIFSFGTSDNEAYQSAGTCRKSWIGTVDKSKISVYGYAFGKSVITKTEITTTEPIYRIIDSNDTITFETRTTNPEVINMSNFVYSGSGGYKTTSKSISVLNPEYSKYIVNLSSNLQNYKGKVTSIQLNKENTFSSITNKTLYNWNDEYVTTKPTSEPYTEYNVYIYTHDASKSIASEIQFTSNGKSLADQKFIIIMMCNQQGDATYFYNIRTIAQACGITDNCLIGTLSDTETTIPTIEGITIHSYSTAEVSLIFNNSEYKGKLTNSFSNGGPAYKQGESDTNISFNNTVSITITKDDDNGNVGKGLRILNSLEKSPYFSILSAHKIETCPADFSIYYGVGQEYNLDGAYINAPSIDADTLRIIGRGKVNANNYSTFKPYRRFNIDGTSLYDDGKIPILSIIRNTVKNTLSVSQLINGHFQGVQESFFGDIKTE